MERKEILAAIGVSAVLAAGWYNFVWTAQGKAADKAQKEAVAAEAAKAKVEGQVKALERTKSELDAEGSQEALLSTAIPDDPELSALVKHLQATAAARHVLLGNIATAQPVAAPVTTAPAVAGGAAAAPTAEPAAEMRLTLAASGAYADVVAFVNDLSSSPRLVVVDSLALSPLQGDGEPKAGDASSVNASLSARVFSTTVVPAGGAAAAAPTGATVTTIAPSTKPATGAPQGDG